MMLCFVYGSNFLLAILDFLKILTGDCGKVQYSVNMQIKCKLVIYSASQWFTADYNVLNMAYKSLGAMV